MEKFIIKCPWCDKISEFEDELAFAAVANDAIIDSAESILTTHKKYIYKCQNRHCPAKFEAIICGGRDVAYRLQSILQTSSWIAPRRFRLRKTEKERYDNIFGILFNRAPLQRWQYIDLSELMPIDILAKYLLGSTVRLGISATIFEAWETEKKVFWIPVEPYSMSSQENMKLFRNSICDICRNIFDRKEKELFNNESQKGSECKYFDSCPTEHKCIEDGTTTINYINRCLLRLEFREKESPCYRSDLAIIKSVENQFNLVGDRFQKPMSHKCWAGHIELAFPISVHNHLVGVIIVGPFITSTSAKNIGQLIKKEREESGKSKLSSEKGKIKKEFSIVKKRHRKKKGIREYSSESQQDEVTESIFNDIQHIKFIAQNRYIQRRDLTESAFRREISGVLTNNLLNGNEFGDFLPYILKRMMQFWAFEHVCLLMGAQWEESISLYSSNKKYFGKTDDQLSFSLPSSHETFLRGVFIANNRKQDFDIEDQKWFTFIEQLKNTYHPIENLKYSQVFLVICHTGSRYYLFCMFGRDPKMISKLSQHQGYSQDSIVDNTRLSERCREHILRSCQAASIALHNFWQIADQEETYRVLSHTLKNPFVIMKEEVGFLHRVYWNKHMGEIQQISSNLYIAFSDLFSSLRIGSDIIKDELEKLSAAGKLEDYFQLSLEQSTDLIKILDDLKKQYLFLTKTLQKAKYSRRWQFKYQHLTTAKIIGNEGVVKLAIRNVLDNAFKYSYENRRIIIDVKSISNEYELVVIDYGLPIRENEMSRIWNKNYRGHYAKKRHLSSEGTGYGLYIVRRIIESINPNSEKAFSVRSNLLESDTKPEARIEFKVRFRKEGEL